MYYLCVSQIPEIDETARGVGGRDENWLLAICQHAMSIQGGDTIKTDTNTHFEHPSEVLEHPFPANARAVP